MELINVLLIVIMIIYLILNLNLMEFVMKVAHMVIIQKVSKIFVNVWIILPVKIVLQKIMRIIYVLLVMMDIIQKKKKVLLH